MRLAIGLSLSIITPARSRTDNATNTHMKFPRNRLFCMLMPVTKIMPLSCPDQSRMP